MKVESLNQPFQKIVIKQRLKHHSKDECKDELYREKTGRPEEEKQLISLPFG